MATPDEIHREFPGPDPEQTSTRRLLVLILDMSLSMGQIPDGQAEPPIKELHAALGRYLDGLRNGTSPFSRNGELAMCALVHNDAMWMVPGSPVRPGSAVFWARYGAEQFPKDELPAAGNTPIGKGVNMCLDLISERVLELQDGGIELEHRPVLLLLTDGKPTDDISTAALRAHAMEDDHDLLIWVAAMKGADTQRLLPLANKGNFVPLGTRAIDSFVQLMSASLQAAAKADTRRSAQQIYEALNAKMILQEEDA